MGRLVQPIDDVRCPICRQVVKWAVSSPPGAVGSAHCQDGRMVSRTVTKNAKCPWVGVMVFRGEDGEVFAPYPLPTDKFPEKTY